VELHVLGKTLPFAATRYESSPIWLAGVPAPLRFACSVLEIGLRPIASGARWSVDQWTPPDEPGYRMGGFFGAYAIVVVIAMAAAALLRRTRPARVGAVFALAATALVSALPQSHELRYYLFWMLLLVSLALVEWARELPRVTAGVALAALAIVVWSTKGIYLHPTGESFASLVATRVDRARIERARPGERLCISEEPWTFLYAPPFHAETARAPFSVQEATTEADCLRP
jgi:hypothetical protein